MFLDVFNRKCEFLESRPMINLSTDASQNGIGSCFEDDWLYSYLAVDYPWLNDSHINCNEAISVVLAAS